MKFEGIYTPVITPFRDDGSIIEDDWARMIEYLIETGVHGLVIGGTTGEVYALSKEERIEQFKKAKDLLEEKNADFFATGEVLHQRPMSQNRKAMRIIAEESGCEDVVLRPLSANNLKATPMEKAGLVDREKLLNIEGR